MDAAITASEGDLLATVLECSTDAILLVDGAGRLSGWNQATERMFRASQGWLRGRSFDGLFPPELHEQTSDMFLRASAGQPARATTVALRNDGSRLVVEAACSAAPKFNGQPSDHVVVLRDVTEPLLLRSATASVAFEADASAALESFALVLRRVIPVDNLTLTAVEGEAARRVASAGRSAAKLRSGEIVPLMGSALSTVVERRMPIVCLDTRAGDLPYDKVLANVGIPSYVVLPLFHGGEVVATLNVGFETVGAPTTGVVELLGLVTDSIMPIVLNLLTLEEQAGAIQRLEHLDALKNEFLALVTHDMRTPLAVIAGFAEELQSRWSELPDAEKLESVDAILRNGRSLFRLVEEGLHVARIEAGDFPYNLRPVALEGEVERTVADLAMAGADRIRVSAEQGLPLVQSDPDRHWHVLTNLLSNALKFSPPHTTIEVELTSHDSMVQVAVRDHGPGIEPSDVPKLFHKFSRVGKPEQLAVRGNGLGLYISKAMVEAQGGQIWVESESGRGSTFFYTLPVAAPGEVAAAAADSS